MEDRKSVLETVRPSDALGRISQRTQTSRAVGVVVAVVLLFIVVFLIATIFHTTANGSKNTVVPRVTKNSN